MAYMSGNAMFIQGTKRTDKPLDSCGLGVLIHRNIFKDNFGFKNSDGGALSLTCNEVTDENRADFLRSSGREANYAYADSKIDKELRDDLDDIAEFRPYKRTSHIHANSFESNHAGRKGSAIFVKGLTSVKIEESTFIRNKAVDSLEEINSTPAYAKYLLETTDGSRLFSFHVDPDSVARCGETEIEYLARCADSKTFIPQSILEGAIYLEGGDGMHCDLDPTVNECAEEKYDITDCTFDGNEINYEY